jgi:Coenzyme PQQ synthesis protein D (PqqD)
MTDSKIRFQPNTENVSAKVLDGEAVLIHVTRGTYHNLEKVGCRVWQLIEGRHAIDTMVSAIVSQYAIDAASAKKDIANLIDALLKEDLILEATDAEETLKLETVADRLPYEAPVLNSHHDMGDLLALDPPMPGLQGVASRSETDEK